MCIFSIVFYSSLEIVLSEIFIMRASDYIHYNYLSKDRLTCRAKPKKNLNLSENSINKIFCYRYYKYSF